MRDEPAEHTGHPTRDARVHDGAAFRARLHGLHRGADVSGEVEIVVEERGLKLSLAGGPVVPVLWAALDGIEHAGSSLSLYLMGDEVLELDADSSTAASLARVVTERACYLGELTLALRGLGSTRARPGSDHEQFYGPLLAARRALEHARTPAAQLAAADAEQLADALRATLARFATERYPGPKEGADRRALEAELTDYAEGLHRALERLAEVRDATRAAPADVRFAWWREWATALRAVFAEHDRTWIAALPALCDPRGQEGGFWRRLLKRGGRSRGASALAFALLSALAAMSAHAQGDDGPRATLRVPGASADSLRRRGFDVVQVNRDREREMPLVVVGPSERARLAREGFASEPLTRGVEARRATAAPLALRAITTVYRSFDDPARGVRVWLDSIALALPGVVRIESIGESWQERPIIAAHVGRADIGAPADDPARPNVLFVATYHAREWIAAEVALRLIRHLATSTDARTRQLADTRDVWIIPVVNPDGYEHTFTTDRLWRKNRRPAGPTGFIGVDLNRNHTERWGLDEFGSSGQPAAETYRGPEPASEPEVKAVQAFSLRVQPVTALSYHSYSGLVLYPPGFADGLLPQDLGVYRALAGTDLAPSVRDRTAGSTIEYYHPGPAWHLYRTNGDYMDWASANGTLAMTTELTSGCRVDCEDGYYGFEFPDDESLIERVFQDNLPLALDMIEAAADPRTFASPSTGLVVSPFALESASPVVRVRIATPSPSTPSVRTVGADGRHASVVTRRDTVPSAHVEARFISPTLASRPAAVTLSASALNASWALLIAGGGESGDTGWESTGWSRVSAGTPPRAGRAFWEGASGDELRSPAILVPEDADTIVVVWWQQHSGNALHLGAAAGEVRVSVDDGVARTVARVGGEARAWYPEQVRLGGLRGRTLRVGFASLGARWRIDEVQVLAEGTTLPVANNGSTLAVHPSANPVRTDRVTFAWPADAGAGEIVAYDFRGRRVWRRTVGAGELTATWDTAAQSLANGAYVVVARAGSRQGRLTLYVSR